MSRISPATLLTEVSNPSETETVCYCTGERVACGRDVPRREVFASSVSGLSRRRGMCSPPRCVEGAVAALRIAGRASPSARLELSTGERAAPSLACVNAKSFRAGRCCSAPCTALISLNRQARPAVSEMLLNRAEVLPGCSLRRCVQRRVCHVWSSWQFVSEPLVRWQADPWGTQKKIVKSPAASERCASTGERNASNPGAATAWALRSALVTAGGGVCPAWRELSSRELRCFCDGTSGHICLLVLCRDRWVVWSDRPRASGERWEPRRLSVTLRSR